MSQMFDAQQLHDNLHTARDYLALEGLINIDVRFSCQEDGYVITVIGYLGSMFTAETMFFMSIPYDPDTFMTTLRDRLEEFNPHQKSSESLIKDLEKLMVRADSLRYPRLKNQLELLVNQVKHGGGRELE